MLGGGNHLQCIHLLSELRGISEGFDRVSSYMNTTKSCPHFKRYVAMIMAHEYQPDQWHWPCNSFWTWDTLEQQPPVQC
jgi:hypothetical protein